jgi:hypothetical protein
LTKKKNSRATSEGLATTGIFSKGFGRYGWVGFRLTEKNFGLGVDRVVWIGYYKVYQGKTQESNQMTTTPFSFHISLRDWVVLDERPHMMAPCEHNSIKGKADDFSFRYRQAINYYNVYGDGIKPKEVHGWALRACVWMNPDTTYQDAVENAVSLNPWRGQCLEFIVADHVGWLEFIADKIGEVFINFDTQSLNIWVSETPEAHCFALVSSKDSIATIADKLRSCMIRYLVISTPAVNTTETDGELTSQEIDDWASDRLLYAKSQADALIVVEKAIDEQSLPSVRVDGKLCAIVLTDHRYLTGTLSGLCYLMHNNKKVYNFSCAGYSAKDGWQLTVKTHRGTKTKCRFSLINDEWQLAG